MKTFSSVSPRTATVVAIPKGLARYATDVTTTSATYSEVEHTSSAIALTLEALADRLGEEKIGDLIAATLGGR